MPSIAQLGISINSSQVTTATAALTGLTGAAKQAGPAVAALNTAAAPANAALGTMQKATVAAATAHGGLSTQAMAAGHSIRSMAEGFAMGMPPMQVLMQQMNHLSYAASGPGGISGAFKEVGATLTRFISPGMLAAGAIGAVAVGFGLAIAHIANAEKAFGQLSEQTGLTIQSLHALESAAATQGIGSPEFLKGVTHFNELSAEATHNIGAMADLFRANGVAVGTVGENMQRVANLVKNAATEQDKYRILQQLGLPATRDWVQFLGQGADKLREATANATAFGGEADEKLIKAAREFDQAWNSAWNSFENMGKSAFVSVWDVGKNFFNTMKGAATFFLHPLDAITGNPHLPIAPGAFIGPHTAEEFVGPRQPVLPAKPTAIPEDIKKQIALEQQRIGILGQTATVEQQVRAVELQIQSARLDGVNISAREAKVLKDNAHDRALGIDQMQASVDSLHTEAGAFTMLAGPAAEYTAIQNKLNQAKRDGQPLTAQNIADIKQQASVLGQATQQIDNMRTASDILGGAMKTFHTQLQNGATTFQALRLSALSALNAIEDKLIDMAAKKLVDAAFSGGGSSFLSSLFGVKHGGYGPGDTDIATRSVPLMAFAGAPRFHSGIGPGEVPAILRSDESVLTPGQMRAIGGAMSRGSNVTVAPTINVGSAPGDDGQARKFAAMIADQVHRAALEAIRDQKRPGGILA